MDRASLLSYERPTRHVAVAEIIQRRSTNRTDVRDAVLRDLDLSFAKTVLDLGSGFGFMIEVLAWRVAPDARIVGVDVCAANEKAYLERVADTGRTGYFTCRGIDTQLDWPDESFDLVVASYSLYFFPKVLPEVVRVLAPRGLFLAVTHTQTSCRELLRAVGLPETDAHLLALLRTFCAENGERVLTPWFGEVQRVDYHNSLVFDAAQPDDFLEYLRFKVPLLLPTAGLDGELPEPLARAARAFLSRQTTVLLEKNDAAFRCRKPRCR